MVFSLAFGDYSIIQISYIFFKEKGINIVIDEKNINNKWESR